MASCTEILENFKDMVTAPQCCLINSNLDSKMLVDQMLTLPVGLTVYSKNN